MSSYQCDKCKKYVDKELHRISMMCGSDYCDECYIDYLIEKSMRSIPEEYQHCTMENFQKTDGNEYALSKVQEKRFVHCFLYGPPGVGKTHLGVSLLKRNARSIPNFKFVSAPDLMAECRMACGNRNGEGPDQLIKLHIQSIGCLLLDDIGIEKPSEFVKEKMYMLIDGRYSSRKPTIITSNISLAELGSRLGERIASRVGSGVVAEITGDDYRLRHHCVAEAFKTNKLEVL